jgi:hypothetical protein
MSGAMGGGGIVMLGAEAGGMLGIGIEAPGNPPGGPGGVFAYCAIAMLAGNAAATNKQIAIVLNRDMVVLPNSFLCASYVAAPASRDPPGSPRGPIAPRSRTRRTG